MMMKAIKINQVGASSCRAVAAILCKKPWRASYVCRTAGGLRTFILTSRMHCDHIILSNMRTPALPVFPFDLQAVL